MNKDNSLDDLLTHVWDSLLATGEDKQHPYRFPAMATYGADGLQQRTVVLRDIEKEARRLVCYSDARTQKVADLQQNPEACFLMYDQSSQEQLRISSRVVLHLQDQEAKKLWDAIPPKGRADYIGPFAPGTPSESYIPNLPEAFQQEPTEENTRQGFDNFCVVSCQIYAIDFLKLMKGGHLRAAFEWKDSQWQKQWIAP